MLVFFLSFFSLFFLLGKGRDAIAPRFLSFSLSEIWGKLVEVGGKISPRGSYGVASIIKERQPEKAAANGEIFFVWFDVLEHGRCLPNESFLL